MTAAVLLLSVHDESCARRIRHLSLANNCVQYISIRHFVQVTNLIGRPMSLQ